MAEGRMRQILWAIGLAALAVPAAAGPAQKPTRTAELPPLKGASIDVAYELSFWFIPFGHTTYHANFENGDYQASSHFNTSGLVSVFWQADIDAGASGRVEKHAVAPFIYDSYAARSAEKKQRVKLTYEPGKPPELLAEPAYDTEKYPVPDKEKEQGVDPMSAIALILTGVSADAKNPCGTVAPVFDGRRRYNIDFTYLHDEKVATDNKLYAGNVHVCELHYKQIAGYKPNMLRGKNVWPPIYAWIADVPDAGAPLGHYTVPVKLWSTTQWGTVTANLSALKTAPGPSKG